MLFQQAPTGIRPQMFKTLIGRGHPEFSTKRQQDAQEFFLHLLTELEVSSTTFNLLPSHANDPQGLMLMTYKG